jgi:ABC-type transporter Mla subunit MlaD
MSVEELEEKLAKNVKTLDEASRDHKPILPSTIADLRKQIEGFERESDENLARILEKMEKLAETPILTREEVKATLENMATFTSDQKAAFTEYVADLQKTVQDFIVAYTKELELQKRQREKEAETLAMLNEYLKRYV